MNNQKSSSIAQALPIYQGKRFCFASLWPNAEFAVMRMSDISCDGKELITYGLQEGLRKGIYHCMAEDTHEITGHNPILSYTGQKDFFSYSTTIRAYSRRVYGRIVDEYTSVY
jgi:hypothetical protein